jgi:hypothetical protein
VVPTYGLKLKAIHILNEEKDRAMSHIVNDTLKENIFEEVLTELLDKHPTGYLPWLEEVAERITNKRMEEMD